MGGEVFLRPAWADAPKEYKKGGKVKKAKKAKSDRISQNVKVNVKIGDSVMLRKGNVPVAKNNPGEAKRLVSQGSVFGGGLPRPLQSMTYMSAPPVAAPLSRMDFIGSADAYYSRNRNKHDDIPIEVNPAGIKTDTTPSKRMVQNNKAEETPDAGLAAARRDMDFLARAKESAALYMKQLASFQGEKPRIDDLNLRPSSRGIDSQPTTGFMNTQGSSIGANVDGASSMGMEEERYLPSVEEEDETLSEASSYFPGKSAEAAVSAPPFPSFGEWKWQMEIKYKRLSDWRAATGHRNAYTWDDAYKIASKQPSPQTLRRGGRVHSAF